MSVQSVGIEDVYISYFVWMYWQKIPMAIYVTSYWHILTLSLWIAVNLYFTSR